MHKKEDFSIDLLAVVEGDALPFSLRAGDSFYEDLPTINAIQGGELAATGELISTGVSSYTLNYALGVLLRLECCRCLEPLVYNLQLEGQAAVESCGDDTLDESDGDTIYVSEKSMQLDLWSYFQETVALALPMRIYHGMEGVESGECNRDMLSRFASESEFMPEQDSEMQSSGQGVLSEALRAAFRERSHED